MKGYLKERRVGALLLLLFSVFHLPACHFPSSEDAQVVSVATSSGVTRGQIVSVGDKSVIEWQDIPYAQPPVGELRWRAPRTLTGANPLPPKAKTTACMQEASQYGGVPGQGVVGSEDCLYLDIRAPLNSTSRDHPVMFWIHGGGNVSGSKDYYNFSRLVAQEDVVVVTVNYRLGALGWLTHPAIQSLQEGIDKTSNFGTLDLIEALRWVQTNISHFGGDAKNVTIFGESAGGHNVFALLASPLADQLFHRAIAQSGYLTSATPASAYNVQNQDPLVRRGSWQMVNRLFTNPDTVTPSEYGQSSWPSLRDKLKALDANDLVAAYVDARDNDYMPLTTSDNIVIPSEGLKAALHNPKYRKDVSVIAGTTRDELSFWLGLHRYFMATHYPFTRWLPPVVKVKNKPLYAFWVSVRSHAWKLRAVDNALGALQLAGYQQLFAYRFDWDDQRASFFADIPNFLGAAHGVDVAFLTGDYRYGPVSRYVYPKGQARNQMERTMMSTWAHFAKTGDPNGSIPIPWKPYSTHDRVFLRLDKDADLALASEDEDLDSLLAQVVNTEVASDLEKCLIVWESLVNVGDPDISRYRRWNEGRCEVFDISKEQQKIRNDLRETYGSVTIF